MKLETGLEGQEEWIESAVAKVLLRLWSGSSNTREISALERARPR
jgi:hypothetical protein